MLECLKCGYYRSVCKENMSGAAARTGAGGK